MLAAKCLGTFFQTDWFGYNACSRAPVGATAPGRMDPLKYENQIHIH